jgi:hypothetical protein
MLVQVGTHYCHELGQDKVCMVVMMCHISKEHKGWPKSNITKCFRNICTRLQLQESKIS